MVASPMYAGQPPSGFLRTMNVALSSQMAGELRLTLEVGVMSAAGLTRAEVLGNVRTRHPGIDELDIRMAHLRLKRLAEGWRE